jgi:alkylhydroperoxidase family enzyme
LAGRATGNERLRVFTTIGWHRRLSRWWLPFSGNLLLRGLLPRADTELLILRTAWNCDGWYEWVQHVPLAARSGLTTIQIAGSAEGPDYPHWTARQRLLVEAADELHQARVIADPTWRRLSAELSTEQSIEMCFVVGHYEMLAMALNSLGVEPEATALRHLDPAAAALAESLAQRLLRSRCSGLNDPAPVDL